jgi:hypothetical protein
MKMEQSGSTWFKMAVDKNTELTINIKMNRTAEFSLSYVMTHIAYNLDI